MHKRLSFSLITIEDNGRITTEIFLHLSSTFQSLMDILVHFNCLWKAIKLILLRTKSWWYLKVNTHSKDFELGPPAWATSNIFPITEVNFHLNRTRLNWHWPHSFVCYGRQTSSERLPHLHPTSGSAVVVWCQKGVINMTQDARMQRRKSLWRSLLPTTDKTVRSVSILISFCLDESLPQF